MTCPENEGGCRWDKPTQNWHDWKKWVCIDCGAEKDDKRRLSPEEIILNSYEFEEWLCNTATPMGDDGFSEKLFWYDAWEEYLGSSDK